MSLPAAVCVFCGSSTPPDPSFTSAARALGRFLAENSITLVYGGGRVGLMGEVADAALGEGGEVIGVIPVGLFSREVGHPGLSQLHEVSSMHERKKLMYDLADGFIAMPGGLGTLEEMAEVATWTQLGIHAKPVVLLDVAAFWEPMIRLLDGMVEVGLLKEANRSIIRLAHSPREALRELESIPAYSEKWIGDAER